MSRKNRLSWFLHIIGFCLINLKQSSVKAQSITAAAMNSNLQHVELQTLKRGVARRNVGEPDTSFLRRTLPVSYPSVYNKLVVAYAWRPTPFGEQLFFSRTNGGDNKYDLFLYILDPFQTNTYAVQAFDIGNMGDLTTVAALFFADVNQDGRKELLALTECDLEEGFKGRDGEVLMGHVPHYQTHVFQYIGINNDGRPQYREDQTPRTYLDELPTAAAVRQAIAKHQQRLIKRKSPQKLSK